MASQRQERRVERGIRLRADRRIIDRRALELLEPVVGARVELDDVDGAIREALLSALADPDLAEARAALGLTGARLVTPADYDRVAEIERGAAAAGYARLA